MAGKIFGTKAETLENLRGMLTQSVVLPLKCFTISQWDTDSKGCLESIRSQWPGSDARVIVRSSAIGEDSILQSNAGRFVSVSNLPVNDSEALAQGIRRVIASYADLPNPNNQFFVQPVLEDVRICGVVFTRDLDTLSPYYIVNFDDETHRTDTVTSGHSNQLKTFIKFRNYPTRNKNFEKLFAAIREIEKVSQNDALDIEFAIDSKGCIFLLQVRPIVHDCAELPKASMVGHYLHKIQMKVEKINHPHPYLHGDRTFLGVMPDWNPAEMIGVKPHPLALSLYKELITDKTWAHQRDNYGYRNLRSCPLIVTLIGHPYIDVRVSFNSFIPKGISEDLSNRLANYYLNALQRSPSSHDKVEFDIVFSCFFFNIDAQLEKLKAGGFSTSDTESLKQALVNLTNNILMPQNGLLQQDLRKIEELRIRQDKILNSNLIPLEKIYWLMEDCRRYGTLPFAGLARAGFVAVQILRSMLEMGIITRPEHEGFMSSLNTIAKRMAFDQAKCPHDEFVKRYGHLRPGTYDILSPSYKDGYDLYFSKQQSGAAADASAFEFSKSVRKAVGELLQKNGICINAEQLVLFLRQAIEAREYAKFVFSRSVSEILQCISELAKFYDLTLEDAAFIDIRTLMHLYATLDHRDLSVILRDEIQRNREFYGITRLIRMPSLLVNAQDIFEFYLEEGRPNFVTHGRVRGDVVRDERLLKDSLENKIVFIPSADPGYDWIFTKKIACLVTMYGGANSHMAIRAAELRIPAVIGAGEKNYRVWSNKSCLEIDCANQQVIVIR